MGYAVGGLGTSSDHGGVWIRVPVRCYTECNTEMEQAVEGEAQIAALAESKAFDLPLNSEMISVCWP